jgi:hypothetical protein
MSRCPRVIRVRCMPGRAHAVALVLSIGPTVVAQPASFQGLGLIANTLNPAPKAISADGSAILGSMQNSGAAYRAFVWTADFGCQDIGLLAGTTSTSPVAISADGSAATGTSDSYGFRWTRAGGLQNLGFTPGASLNTPVAISADGLSIVGSCQATSGTVLYRWDTSLGIQALAQGPDERPLVATSCSSDGSIVFGTLSGRSPYVGWQYSAGALHTLPVLGGSLGAKAGLMSDDGHVLYGQANTIGGGFPTVRWDQQGVTPIAGNPYWGIPVAVSADGSVIVGAHELDLFRYSAGSISVLPPPSGATTVSLRGLSADGAIAWGTATRSGYTSAQPIIWTPGGPAWLTDALQSAGADLTGWSITVTNVMSRDGTTWSGYGTDPTGHREPFVARLPR